MDDKCAKLPAKALGGQATSYHFRTLADAQTFLDAFPMLELADGTGNLRFDNPRSF